jgi:hypothetical protein
MVKSDLRSLNGRKTSAWSRRRRGGRRRIIFPGLRDKQGHRYDTWNDIARPVQWPEWDTYIIIFVFWAVLMSCPLRTLTNTAGVQYNMSQEHIAVQCQVLSLLWQDRQCSITVMKVYILVLLAGVAAATQIPAPTSTKISVFGEFNSLLRLTCILSSLA